MIASRDRLTTCHWQEIPFFSWWAHTITHHYAVQCPLNRRVVWHESTILRASLAPHHPSLTPPPRAHHSSLPPRSSIAPPLSLASLLLLVASPLHLSYPIAPPPLLSPALPPLLSPPPLDLVLGSLLLPNLASAISSRWITRNDAHKHKLSRHLLALVSMVVGSSQHERMTILVKAAKEVAG